VARDELYISRDEYLEGKLVKNRDKEIVGVVINDHRMDPISNSVKIDRYGAVCSGYSAGGIGSNRSIDAKSCKIWKCDQTQCNHIRGTLKLRGANKAAEVSVVNLEPEETEVLIEALRL
jgi:hypothetical protein